MPEIQARLTNDPNDKEPLHKKQPTAVSSSEVRKRSDKSNHSSFNRCAELMNLCARFWPELACISPSNRQLYIEELKRREVALEPFPAATEYTIVGMTHQITTFPPAFGDKRETRTRFLSLPKRLKRIFRCTEARPE